MKKTTSVPSPTTFQAATSLHGRKVQKHTSFRWKRYTFCNAPDYALSPFAHTEHEHAALKVVSPSFRWVGVEHVIPTLTCANPLEPGRQAEQTGRCRAFLQVVGPTELVCPGHGGLDLVVSVHVLLGLLLNFHNSLLPRIITFPLGKAAAAAGPAQSQEGSDKI